MDDKNQLRNTIAKNLANLRKNKKLTQAELAQKFGYSDKAVSKWETGETLPDIEILYSLCTFYDVSLDFLTHEITEENKNQYVTHYNRRIENPRGSGRKVVSYEVCKEEQEAGMRGRRKLSDVVLDYDGYQLIEVYVHVFGNLSRSLFFPVVILFS